MENKDILQLSIECGQYLVSKDSTGKSDPFILYGLVDDADAWIGKPARTPTVSQDLNPVFSGEGSRHEFEVPASAKRVKFECWDYDFLTRNDWMGFATFPIDKLVVSDSANILALDLEPLGNERVSGAITVGYTFQTAEYKQKKQNQSKRRAFLKQKYTSEITEQDVAQIGRRREDVESMAAAFAMEADVHTGHLQTEAALENVINRCLLDFEMLRLFGMKQMRSWEVLAVKFATDPESRAIRRSLLWRLFDLERTSTVTWEQFKQNVWIFIPTKFNAMQTAEGELLYRWVKSAQQSVSREHMLAYFKLFAKMRIASARALLPVHLVTFGCVPKPDSPFRDAYELADDIRDHLVENCSDLPANLTEAFYKVIGSEKENEQMEKEDFIQVCTSRRGSINVAIKNTFKAAIESMYHIEVSNIALLVTQLLDATRDDKL